MKKKKKKTNKGGHSPERSQIPQRDGKQQQDQDSGATGTKKSWDLVGTLNPTILFLLIIHMSVCALPVSQSLGNYYVKKKAPPTFYISFLVTTVLELIARDFFSSLTVYSTAFLIMV